MVLSKQSIGRWLGRLSELDEAGWLAPRSEADEGSGKLGYHWCAVDQDGEVLDFYFTPTRDEGAALAFLRRSLKNTGIPQVAADGDCPKPR